MLLGLFDTLKSVRIRFVALPIISLSYYIIRVIFLIQIYQCVKHFLLFLFLYVLIILSIIISLNPFSTAISLITLISMLSSRRLLEYVFKQCVML